MEPMKHIDIQMTTSLKHNGKQELTRKERLSEELFSRMESLRAEMELTKHISSVSEPTYKQLKEEALAERFSLM